MITHLEKQKKAEEKGFLPSNLVSPPVPNYQFMPPPFSHPFPHVQQQYHQNSRPENYEKPIKTHKYRPKEDKGVKSQEGQKPKIKLSDDDFPEMK